MTQGKNQAPHNYWGLTSPCFPELLFNLHSNPEAGIFSAFRRMNWPDQGREDTHYQEEVGGNQVPWVSNPPPFFFLKKRNEIRYPREKTRKHGPGRAGGIFPTTLCPLLRGSSCPLPRRRAPTSLGFQRPGTTLPCVRAYIYYLAKP